MYNIITARERKTNITCGKEITMKYEGVITTVLAIWACAVATIELILHIADRKNEKTAKRRQYRRQQRLSVH